MAKDKEIIIEPLLDKNIKLINPAIDVMGDSAFIGAWIPCKVTETERDKDGKETVKVYFKQYPYYITDKRELKLVDEKLLQDGYALTSEPVQMKPKWDIDHINNYLNGGETPNLAEVFKEIVAIWREYVEFEDWREYIFRTCWDIGTYFAHLSNAYIFDYLGGVKETGKTKTLDVHSCLAFNAIHSANMSPSTIFRMVQNCRSTLCVDESEVLDQTPGKTMSERTYDLRNILLSGYKKGAPVYRTEKREGTGKLMPEPFDPYGPKAIANIKGVENTLEDRCKTTIMKRATGAAKNREIDYNDPRWARLRDKLCRIYLAKWRRFIEIYRSDSTTLKSPIQGDLVNVVDECSTQEREAKKLTGREKELWKPILTIALLIEEGEGSSVYSVYNDDINKGGSPNSFIHAPPTLAEVLMELAVDSIKAKKTEDVIETSEMCLVQALLRLVAKDDFYAVRTIRAEIGKFYDDPQQWITPKWVGNAMKRLGFREKRRVGSGVQFKLEKGKVEDVANRLGVSKVEEPPTEPENPKEGQQTLSQWDKLHLVMSVIAELEEKYDGRAPVSLVLETCVEKGLKRETAEIIIEEEKRVGRLYEPKPGTIARAVKGGFGEAGE